MIATSGKVLFTAFILAANAAIASAQATPSPPATPSPDPVKEDLDVVRINTTLVTVPVRVMDRNGKYVPDMRREEFRLFEEGVEQQLAYFAPVQSPFIVVFMIDNSDSTESSLNDIKKAALAFIGQLRPDDEVIIITFDSRVAALGQPTADREVLRKMIESIRPGSGTRLYDAMDRVFKRLLNQIQARKAVVLFTDGVDVDSRVTAEQTLHDAEETDALIYSVRYDTYAAITEKLRAANSSLPLPVLGSGKGSRQEGYALARAYLKGLADKSGARMYETSDPRELLKAFALIAEELRWQYSLGYYPVTLGQPGQRRKIKVRVGDPKLVVRARSSYVYDRLNAPTQLVPEQ